MMNQHLGSSLSHSYEVSGYWRTTPSGKKIWVEKYVKKGSIRQDEFATNKRMAELRTSVSRNALAKKGERIKEILTHPDYQNPNSDGAKQWKKYVLDKAIEEHSEASNAHFKDEMALKKARREEENQRYDNEKIADTIRLDGLEIAENAKIAIHNFVADTKADAEDVINGASKAVKETVESGWKAVKNFFAGLFGRR